MFLQLCLGVVTFKTCLFHTQSHVTLTALFLSPPLALHTTPQVRLRPGRPMFAAAVFEPSDT